MATNNHFFDYDGRKIELVRLLPNVLQPIADFKGMANASCAELEPLYNGMLSIVNDQFLDTASATRIEKWEKSLGLIPNANDSLGERRVRIFSKLNDFPPYTDGYLLNKLTALCGKDQFEIVKDYNNYKLNINLTDRAYVDGKTLTEMLRDVVPSNIILTVSDKLNSHNDLRDLTHAEMATHTHAELRYISANQTLGQVTNIKVIECCPSIARITWNAVNGADSYEVYQSMDEISWELVKSTTVCSMNIAGLTDDTEYYYRVCATAGAQYGAYSDVVSVTTHGLPTKVTSFEVSQQNHVSVKFAWINNHDVDYYTIFKYNDGLWESCKKYIVSSSTPSNLSGAVGDLTPETTYVFSIRGSRMLDGVEYFGDATYVTIKLVPHIKLEQISDLQVRQEGTNEVILVWSRITDAKKYKIQRSTDGINWIDIETVLDTVNYHDTNLIQNVEYYYRVRAEASLSVGEYSSPVGVILYGTPEQVKNVTATPSSDSTKVTCTWKSVSHCDEYEILKYENGDWNVISTVNAYDSNNNYITGTVTYTFDHDCTEPGYYGFSVRACERIYGGVYYSELSDENDENSWIVT